jgi:EAL domain-containing protein (putative c-di-GMP-specific phosphodiesterase class I)
VAALGAAPPPGAASGSDAPAQARGAERRPPAPGAASPSLADQVRTALDAGELLLYAQPVFHLRSGEVAHREVLVQMRGGSGEVRPAAEFLAAAAQVPGLCADIDRWVVEQALVTAADGAGRSRLHVNLAGETVNDAGHLERFISILAGLRGHAAGIGLEIGEATVDRNPVAASAGVRQLAGTGCAVILDGFTGGFGSFEYLQRLPLDQVKIDGAVTRPLLHGGADHATLRAIVKLARGTGKTTVAKQIESEALVPILRTHGVDLAQGFELGAPRPLAGG